MDLVVLLLEILGKSRVMHDECLKSIRLVSEEYMGSNECEPSTEEFHEK